ncbi:hypothetical protein AABM38_22570 [Heyndrickxia sp. MSNUG]|uniref:hypothetical protein n=1 Tax=Heyndrickxia sp. MSNUG TaxID=3136677 RepID=UPI003C2B5891
MKKTLKMAIFTVLVLLVGGAGVLYYYLNVKEYDVADKKVEEITKKDYQIDLPDLDGAVTGEDGSSEVHTDRNAATADPDTDSDEPGKGESAEGAKEDTKVADTTGDAESKGDAAVASGHGSSTEAASKKTSTKSDRSKSSAGTQSSNNGSENKEDGNPDRNTYNKPVITAETIKAAYRPAFESLQSQANAKVDALVNTAFSEYQSKKQSGESVSITYFFQKYTSAGKEIESNTDETFNYIYGALVNDLENRGFSSSEANEFKTQYENAKSARESALISKAKSAL